MADWQTIDTAPREAADGILGYYDAIPGIYHIAWHGGQWVSFDGEITNFHQPCMTHWRPLPAPPYKGHPPPKGADSGAHSAGGPALTTDPIAAARALIATLADAVEAERALTKRATDGWSAAQDAKIAALERAEKVEAGRDALVAAAYVVAADACKACAPSPAGGPSSRTNSMRVIAFDCASSVRCLTPAHAQAALDKLLAEARLEGWRAGREAAADEVQSCTHDPYVIRAIRAMPEPMEARYG